MPSSGCSRRRRRREWRRDGAPSRAPALIPWRDDTRRPNPPPPAIASPVTPVILRSRRCEPPAFGALTVPRPSAAAIPPHSQRTKEGRGATASPGAWAPANDSPEKRAMLTRMGILSLFTTLVPCGALFAADLPASAPIKAVTVFPDRAEVTRVVDVELPAGATTLVIDNLPASLFPESLRVSGEGGKDVVIGSVETKPVYADAIVSEQERQLQAQIVDLQDRRHAAEDRIASLQVQLDFIATIGRDMPTTANQEIQRGSMDPAKWQAAWTAMSGGAAEAHAGMRAAEIEMRDIDTKIAKLQQELAQIQTGRSATVSARINLEAGAAEGATLRLSYQLPDATWQPLYDARLDSEAGKMSLAQLGQVQQRTGEDWTGVALTLSTAQPSVGAALPELDSWFVQVAQPELNGEMRRDVGAAGAPATSEPQNMADMDELQKEKDDKLTQVKAQLVASEFSAEYRIPGTANVPSDAAPHKFAIATHEMP